MTRDEIVERVAAVLGIDVDNEEEMEEAGIILFDGMENAFLGVAERFVEGGHTYFVVYSYKAMVQILVEENDPEEEVEPGTDPVTDAIDYLEFNTVGLYAGPGTPAILRDMEEHL